MRPTNMRCPRTVRLTAGALAIVAPTSAVALAAGQPDAQTTLQITPASSRLQYGQMLTVTGLAPRADGGQRLALEFSGAGSSWRALAHTKVHSDGAFRLRAPLTRSGAVRVAAVPAIGATAAAKPIGAPTPAAATTSATTRALPPLAATPSQHVAVAAKLVAAKGAIDALSGQQLELGGTLLPRRAGRLVRLQASARGGWRTIAVARTAANGRFVLLYRSAATGEQSVRVSFTGDSGNAAVTTARRELVLFEPAVASWYDDGGNTACGFHAADGIASKGLPCGTKVTLDYHGRTVAAVVDDRGPYVPGREFDLDQTTASVLGFDGVDTVGSWVQPSSQPSSSAAHHRAPSAGRRRLDRECSSAASPTSTWTLSMCRWSFGGGPSSGAKPWWSREAGRARS
jgi:rare lipoprotein A